MAAHRELWHKGLQRRALLTRKLGLGANWLMAMSRSRSTTLSSGGQGRERGQSVYRFRTRVGKPNMGSRPAFARRSLRASCVNRGSPAMFVTAERRPPGNRTSSGKPVLRHFSMRDANSASLSHGVAQVSEAMACRIFASPMALDSHVVTRGRKTDSHAPAGPNSP